MRGLVFPLLLAVLLLAVRLSAPVNLMYGDQGKSAQYVLYAWQTGNFVVPLERGSVLPTKPPLPTWLSLLTCRLAGRITEFELRIPNVLGALLLVVLTYLIARRAADPPLPAVAALIVSANYVFLKSATMLRPDMTLAVLTTAAICTGEYGLRKDRRWAGPVLFVLLGLGVLAKGPIAVLIVVLALVPWLLLRGEGKALRRLDLRLGAVLFLLVVAAWAVPAWIDKGRALAKVMIVDELSRHAGGGRQPVYGYFLTFPGRFLPWVLFLPFGLVWAWRSRTSRLDWPLGLPFCWFAFPFLALCAVGSKRPEYLLPVLPAAAILCAYALLRSKLLTRVLLAVVGIALLAGLAATAVLGPDGIADLIPKKTERTEILARLLEERYPLALGALALGAALAALGWLAALRERAAPAALAPFGLFLLGTAVTYHGFSEVGVKFQSAPPLAMRALDEARSRDAPVLVHGIGSGANSLLFYLGQAGPVADEERIRDAIRRRGRALVVTTPQVDELLKSKGFDTTRIQDAVQVPGKLTYRLVLVRSAP